MAMNLLERIKEPNFIRAIVARFFFCKFSRLAESAFFMPFGDKCAIECLDVFRFCVNMQFRRATWQVFSISCSVDIINIADKFIPAGWRLNKYF